MKNVGIIGCGNIAETYFRAQKYFNNINIIACADIKAEAAQKYAKEYKIINQSVEEIIQNPDYSEIFTNYKEITEWFQLRK